MAAPVAKKVPVTRSIHGEEVVDDYGWLRDRNDPEVVAYLERENAHSEQAMADSADLRQRIFDEIKNRVQETDLSAPAPWGGWWYGQRTEEGQQYPRFVRFRGSADGPEQLMLDQNLLAQGHEFCALGTRAVSPDHRLLAYSVDLDGSEKFTLKVRDLDTGNELADEVAGTYYGAVWAADGEYLFYTMLDPFHRPYQLWRHRLGDDQSEDALTYEEKDERFFLEIGTTRDRKYLLCVLASSITREVRYLPTADPNADLRLLIEREEGIRYSVDHKNGRWLIVTEKDAPNGRLVSAPLDRPDQWTELIPHRPDRKVAGVMPFADHLVIVGRSEGLSSITVIPDVGPSADLTFEEPVYNLSPGVNLEYETTILRLNYQSFLTPPTVYDVDLQSGERTVVKQTPVLGGYDSGQYRQRREWTVAIDGTEIPISIVYKNNVELPAPTVLYGYGAYESCVDPWFSHARLSLLDRGVVFAIAHVRGGGEMGKLWHEGGRMATKINTFTDFTACARYLVSTGVTKSDQLAARGASAGGLLMGSITNLAPELFKAVVAEVPFVDAVNTMLDPTIPLTVIEWEEWGNPQILDQYRWIREYAPYENLAETEYPALLVTAGLNDPRVAYWEPAKWVARLRTVNRGDAPILLKTEMGAGHAGPSGRYDAWRDEAFVLAFVLDQLGVSSQ